jgi:hypothetical protein
MSMSEVALKEAKILLAVKTFEVGRTSLGQFPAGMDEQSIRELIDYYDTQTDEDAAAEHEEALAQPTWTLMDVPTELVPVFRELIARHQQKREHRKGPP